MSTFLGKTGRSSILGICTLLWAAAGQGATLYSVALPSGSSVNAASGRSNYDWLNCGDVPCDMGGGAATGGFVYGDAFTLASGSNYIVNSISVYAAANLTSDNTAAAFASEFSAINLYFGDYADQTSGCSLSDSCSFPIVASNPIITAAGYTGASNCAGNGGYLASDGATCVPIYQVTFAVNLLLVGGNAYQFAADGVLAPGLTGCVGSGPGFNGCGWYTLASTGGNGTFYGWDTTDFSGGSFAVNNSPGTNMNVIVTGDTTTLPEPGSLTLSGLGVVGVALAAAVRGRNFLRTPGSLS